MKKLLLLLVVSTLALTPSVPAFAEDDPVFKANEVSLDVFAGYQTRQQSPLSTSINSLVDGGTWRGGIGGNYFFTRNLGVSLESHVEDFHGNAIDNAALSAVVRLPLDKARLAPYVFGGASLQFEGRETWSYHGGLGLELRLLKRVGVFSDVRYSFGDGGPDNGLIRLGTRFVF